MKARSAASILGTKIRIQTCRFHITPLQALAKALKKDRNHLSFPFISIPSRQAGLLIAKALMNSHKLKVSVFSPPLCLEEALGFP
jgi:hypothetical protein